MDEIGTCTIQRIRRGDNYAHRITQADPRIRIAECLVTGDFDVLRDYVTVTGDLDDVLTIRDDYGQRFIYRIHWDDHADGGYLAEWPD